MIVAFLLSKKFEKTTPLWSWEGRENYLSVLYLIRVPVTPANENFTSDIVVWEDKFCLMFDYNKLFSLCMKKGGAPP